MQAEKLRDEPIENKPGQSTANRNRLAVHNRRSSLLNYEEGAAASRYKKSKGEKGLSE